jgi:ABC-type branched-subunit amino acid transport system ATPase component
LDTTTAALVEAQGVSIGYDKQAVVHDLDLQVRPGVVVASLGPTGAGKTTTLLALCGELVPLSGTLLVDGVPNKMPLHKRARAGLSFVTEERSIFMSMTTSDNLRVGRVAPDEAFDKFPELKQRARIRGGLLSGGEQQMLTLSRAIARQPKLLLADELSLGLAPLIVRRLLDMVREAADNGAGVVLVEQHVRQALRIADRGYIMQRGRVMMQGTATELLEQIDDIEARYLS